MDHTPEISVGMPVFNGGRHLRAAVESILAQSFGDFELIISDNASTDDTPEICRSLARTDKRILYRRNAENLGAARNYNSVFRRARARYFRWANADDLSGPTLHEQCYRALEQNPEAVLAYGGTVIIDENGDRVSEYLDNLDLRQESPYRRFVEFFDRLGLTNIIYGLMRTEAVRKGPLMGDGSLPAADVLFMAALTLQGQFIEVPDGAFFRRIHPASSSRDRGDAELQQDFWSAGKHVFTRPQWNNHKALLRVVIEAGLPLMEQMRLVAYVLHRMFWRRREIVEEFRGRRKGR